MRLVAGQVDQVIEEGSHTAKASRPVEKRLVGGTSLDWVQGSIDTTLDGDEGMVGILNVAMRNCQGRDIADVFGRVASAVSYTHLTLPTILLV